MKDIVVFIVDDILNIVYNNKIVTSKLKNILDKGIIIDKDKFVEEFFKTVKKEKIKSKLFGGNIVVVKNYFYDIQDIFYLENVFAELGFLKVNFLDIRDLLPNDNTTYIEINNAYLVIYLKYCVFLDLNIFKDIPKILEYFKNDCSDNIILFGLNKLIPKIKLENKNVYYFENYNKYILESLLKVKKYGA